MNIAQRILLLAFICSCQLSAQEKTTRIKPWNAAELIVDSQKLSTYRTTVYANPFSGNYRSILSLAPELTALTGIRIVVDVAGNVKENTIDFSLNENANLIIGITNTSDPSPVRKINWGKGTLSEKPILEKAIQITELNAPDVYSVSYKKGKHTINIPEGLNFQFIILGAVPANQKMTFRNVELGDASNYPAFYIDGFTENKPLFTIVGGPDNPVVNVGMPGTENIQGGFEAGSAVKVNGVYHMFPTERAGEQGVHISHDRVKTRIGHWTSSDAIHWTRQSTILESSGVYALVPEDNPMNDRRSAIWSFNVVFSEENNKWYGYYLAYTTDKKITPNHSFGRIWRCESESEGIEGIGGPYRDTGIIMEPGLDSQLWEGRQGVASFYPFKVENGWNAFISGAFPFETKEDYPLRGGTNKKAWHVGLAKSGTMEGPWTRMGEDINPITSIHPTFVENPIVSRLPTGVYIALYDGGPDYLKLPNKIAYTLSKDGINWSSSRYLAIDSNVNKWWMTMRTPLCLIPEGDNIYTVIYTAWVKDPNSSKANTKTRFNPIGMVKVKLDPDALDALMDELFPEIPQADKVGAAVMPADIAPIKNAPFDMPQLQKPEFPDFSIDIKAKGAKEDTPITAIVNQAIIETSEKGGGTVIIPEGKWKSGCIVLKSNVNLHISESAEIEFSGNTEDYQPAVFTRHEGIDIWGAGAFIYASDEKNIAVTGKGIISGPPLNAKIRKQSNSVAFAEDSIMHLPAGRRLFDGLEGRRFFAPKVIAPINCTNVFIEGVSIEKPLFWVVNPCYCENVIIRGVTVNSVGLPSGDGIDISSCKNVLIEYCTLNCGDDCFTLKSGRGKDGLQVGKPTENVVIRYSLAKKGHGGITCGSETAGSIRNIYAHDCVCDGTRIGIRFKTRRNRGGTTENIVYEKIRMIGVGEAFTWDLLGIPEFMGKLAERLPVKEINELTPVVKNIHIKNFIVESANRLLVANAIPEIPLNNVLIENGQINCKNLIPGLNDVDGFTLRNLTVKSQDNKINILDGRNILFENIDFKVPNNEVRLNKQGDNSENIKFTGVVQNIAGGK